MMEVYIYASQRAGTAFSQSNSTHAANTTTPPAFPFVVQISERWVQNGTRAYCEQQVVEEGGTLRKSDAPRYFLSTADVPVFRTSEGEKDGGARAGGDAGGCWCEWIVQ